MTKPQTHMTETSIFHPPDFMPHTFSSIEGKPNLWYDLRVKKSKDFVLAQKGF
jgi:hypothetical protein